MSIFERKKDSIDWATHFAIRQGTPLHIILNLAVKLFPGGSTYSSGTVWMRRVSLTDNLRGFQGCK
jgi:hypothetical protein